MDLIWRQGQQSLLSQIWGVIQNPLKKFLYVGKRLAMTKGPVVTVYIPTFNRRKMLERAVFSVLNQDFSDIELIVVDDGSSDGTIEFMMSIVEKDSRVRFFRNDSNFGACYSRNKAIELARGKFITGLDDDDYFTPNRISTFLKAWAEKPARVIGICSNSKVITSSHNIKQTRRPFFIYQVDLLQSNYVGNQVFALKETYVKAGGFDESFPAWQDLDLWYRMLSCEGARIMCINDATYVQDISHEHERISNSSENKVKMAMDMFVRKYNIERPYKDFLNNVYAAYGFGRPSLIVGFKQIIVFKNFRSVRNFLALMIKVLIFKK